MLEIDNEHHVPLIASAIMGDNGEMTGLAIDHRVNPPLEYLPHLALHEATELPLMHDYMAEGMSASDAYTKSHPVATTIESASVRGYAARNGLDPDTYQEQYKQFFRDAAGIAAQPSKRGRHGRAHTTVHGLDEAEGAYKVAEDTGTHAPITKSDIHDPFATPPKAPEHKPLQIDPMASGGPSGAYAPMMKLPSGKEISLARSLKEVTPERREEVLNRIFQRQFPGTKSIGFQKKEFEEAKKKFQGGKNE